MRDAQTVLRILVCLVEQSKRKEIHFAAEDYDSMKANKLLVLDYQRAKGIISLRVTEDNGAAVSVVPESHQWTLPFEQTRREKARSEATKEVSRRAVPTDEELADMEMAAARRQNLASMEDEGKSPLRINIKQ
jgi:hypothetical protein